MSLTNFRQFNGTQSISFSVNPEKNVTVIMGENGSGKTTLAQAFTWCLYGATDFDDQVVLNKAIAQNIGPNGEATVQIKISMVHLGVDYTMTREQKYMTDSTGNLKRPNNTVFKIQYKNSDGQQEFIKESEVELRMKEILPKELAKYFFFDGERIGNMSKEIRKGKSKEFADAVKSLLGLSAFTEALEHLGGRSANTVIKSYESDYDSKSDSKIAQLRDEISRYDALKELVDADKLDTGIPDIHARTIQFLINRKKCLCGAPIEFGGAAYTELNKVLDYIPPKSIGTLIGQFARECELKSQGAADAFDDISNKFSVVSGFDADYADLSNQIETINKKLEGMLNVGELQKKYTFYDGEVKKLRAEKVRLVEEKGGIGTKRERCETGINELVLKDDNNRRVARFKAYATYMYKYLFSVYKEKETEVREQLEETVNTIFKEIYNGGFSLKLDEKYNIQIQVDDFEGYSGDVETSTAQSISVIFAFIAGVIKMARENNSDENSMLMTEAYPLVMDAPLSAFDKTRIKTVCDALPKVAEQVIIFIKDTDGEIAEDNMGSKVGMRYMFDKKNEFETELIGR